MNEQDQRCVVNTDRELWRERDGDYYADSIHVTTSGGIGINCGGYVIVMPLRDWHTAAGGNHPRSGLRGDPGAPRASGDDTRDPQSSSSPAITQALITALKECLVVIEFWSDWVSEEEPDIVPDLHEDMTKAGIQTGFYKRALAALAFAEKG